MSIITAEETILTALQGLDIDLIDDIKTPRIEGNTLSFEGMRKTGFAIRGYVFGLYVKMKIMDRKNVRIYSVLDDIESKITERARYLQADEISMKSILPVEVENGVVTYRCEIHVTQK